MNTTEEIIEDLRQGKMVIIMDDEDRENEGDLLMAASFVKADDVNFMARYGRGLICLTLTEERCLKLRLPLMVTDNQATYSTNFTVSIEAAEGVTTGISAADRALTIQKAVASDVVADDLVQPGHIFPLMAQAGGVLNRAGHTEAGCDFAKLAGVEPAAMIVEILNEDGSMARKPDLEAFAQQHDLKMGTIADLIHYRIKNENPLKRISICHYPTELGEFELHTYQDENSGHIHLALVMGDVDTDEPVLVRVQACNLLDDLLLSTRSNSSITLHKAMQKIAENGQGVLVIIRDNEDNQSLLNGLHQHELPENTHHSIKRATWRTTGTGARILTDLGIKKLKVMGIEKKYFGLSGYDLEIVEHIE